jgi:hypothetical protein
MRRNGYTNEAECSRSSGLMNTVISLAGGVGIGAGLLYLLDPDKGVKRRQQLMESASDLASSAGEKLGHIGSTVGSALGSAGEYAGEKLGQARDYAGEALSGASDYASDYASGGISRARKLARQQRQHARDFIQRQTFGETRAEHRLGVTICALGCMALGAGLMYVLDPTMGRGRRRMMRERAESLASDASSYAHQAKEAIRGGIESAKDKVGDMTSGMTGSSGTTSSAGSSMPLSQPASTTMPGGTCTDL